MSKLEGLVCRSEIQRSATDKFFLFQLVNGYIGYLISGSILTSLSGILEDPTSIVNLLALAVPRGMT